MGRNRKTKVGVESIQADMPSKKPAKTAAKTSGAPSPDKPSFWTRSGVREAGFLVLCALAVFLAAALGSFDVNDPSWFHQTFSSKTQNITGTVGAAVSATLFFLVGYVAWLIPVALLYLGWQWAHSHQRDGTRHEYHWGVRAFGLLLFLLTATTLLSLHTRVNPGDLPVDMNSSGGYLGQLIAEPFRHNFKLLGSTLFLGVFWLIGVSLFTGVTWREAAIAIGKALRSGFYSLRAAILSAMARRRAQKIALKEEQAKQAAQHKEPMVVVAQARSTPQTSADSSTPKGLKAAAAALGGAVGVAATKAKTKATTDADKAVAGDVIEAPELDGEMRRGVQARKVASKKGQLPPVELLDEAKISSHGYSNDELDLMARQIEGKLADFGVTVKIVSAQTGPVITRFELNPAAGVKSAQIVGLGKDLARSMSVVSVRVVEVIPGKPYVGLEVPNQKRQMVSMRAVFDSDEYRNSASKVTIALGKDIAGNPAVTDLAKMPHCLVAGTTGAGKSVAVNVMLLSMLYKSTAEDMRLILIDPKMLELSVYEGIPHLLAPVVTDMKDAANALRWCVNEMERRYKLMSALGVRNVKSYNEKVKAANAAGKPIPDPLFVAKPNPFVGDLEDDSPIEEIPTLETMPFVVIIVDEMADMMLTVGKKVEELILRLAQKARAAGLHLILATQRPSVDVITGLIRANIPSRIAFKVASKIDSRTILDQGGAETLLGMGDMLFSLTGSPTLQRIHGAFVDDHEVHNVVAFLKAQGPTNYDPSILSDSADMALGGGGGDMFGDTAAESDPMYDQAVQVVTETRKASISSVQRRLRVGYNRAARMIEDMEAAGVVSSPDNKGTREVLAPPPYKD